MIARVIHSQYICLSNLKLTALQRNSNYGTRKNKKPYVAGIISNKNINICCGVQGCKTYLMIVLYV